MKTHHTQTHCNYPAVHQSNSNNQARAMKRWKGGVEVNAGASSLLDVRFLCVAIDYPHMFRNPRAVLSIERQWATAFTLSCMEIDALLGRHNHWFQWTQLDIHNGSPVWQWSLGKQDDQQDVHEERKAAINLIVSKGTFRAMHFNQSANDAGELQ
jgi:hypothetical protein